MRSRLLIAAFVLDAACAVLAPFAIGLFPETAEAADQSNSVLVSSEGRCYELSQLGEARWQIQGEADLTACEAMNAN